MTLPKESQERDMPAVEQHQPMRPGGAAKEPNSSEFGWRMPGGEDLLKFALSAGLATGVWWLEKRPDGTAPEESEDACTVRSGSGGKK
jgi:hypothetical protein